MIDIFVDINRAIRRAKHFTKNLSWDGEFSLLSSTGLSIPIRNSLDALRGTEIVSVEYEIYECQWMAGQINKWIDNHLVEGDDETIWALAAFLNRFEYWCDWSKLLKEKTDDINKEP